MNYVPLTLKKKKKKGSPSLVTEIFHQGNNQNFLYYYQVLSNIIAYMRKNYSLFIDENTKF